MFGCDLIIMFCVIGFVQFSVLPGHIVGAD